MRSAHHFINICLFIALICTAKVVHASDQLNQLLSMPMDSLASMPAQQEASRAAHKDPATQPVLITILTANDIRAFGYRNMADIMNALPGIFTTNDQIYTYVGARGVSGLGNYNSRILITVDGYRFNDNIYRQIGLSGDEFPIDIELIDRVEFVPGPASANFGYNAFLGIVNIITRSASSQHKAELTTSYATGNEWRARGTAFADIARGSLMLSYSKLNAEGFKWDYPSGVARNIDDQRADKLFAKYERGAFHANILYSDRYKQVPNAIEYTEFGNPNTFYQDRYTMADLRYRWFETPKANFTTRLHWGNYRFDGNYAYANNVNYRGGAEGNWWGIEFHTNWQLNEQHKLQHGLIFQDNTRQWLYTGLVGGVSPVIDATVSTQVASTWLEDRWQMTPKLLTIAGVRVDHNLQQKTFASPKLGAVYQLSSDDTLRINYAEAWLSPNIYQLRYGSKDPSSGFQSPNPKLNPEYIKSLDVSWEHQHDYWGRFGFSGFTYQTQDMIELVQPSPGAQEIHLNRNDLSANGLQLEWSKATASDWRVSASTTFQAVTERGQDWQLDAPEQLAKFQLRLPRFLGIKTGIEWQYVGERRQRDAQALPANHLVNLTFTKPITNELRAQLSFYNLLDQAYRVPLSADFPEQSTPQPGRVVRVKLEWRF